MQDVFLYKYMVSLVAKKLINYLSIHNLGYIAFCTKMKGSFCYSLLFVVVVTSFKDQWLLCAADDPTDGFTQVPLTDDNFVLQKPYNVPLYQRYNYSNGVRSFWVYNRDKPFKSDSGTRPRTEVRIKVTD